MKLWRIDGDGLVPFRRVALDTERQLHRWLEADIALLDPGLLVIGSEVPTAHGGRIDLLAIDAEGVLTIVEIKRDKTAREVVAQALDYASWVAELDTPSVHRIADDYWGPRGSSLAGQFAQRFATDLPEPLNASHRIVIVAGSLDAASRRIVAYLSQRHGLGINTAFFAVLGDGDQRLLAADWLLDQHEVIERNERRIRAPWSGAYYVNVGEGSHRCWADMRQFGFIAAGHGRPYIDAICRLAPGDPIWAYQSGKGYVGHGIVTEPAAMARDVRVDGTPLLELPLANTGLRADQDDADLAEYVAAVDWRRTFPLDEAQTFKGIFANPNVVCRLTEPKTLAFLHERFGIEAG